MGIKLKKPTQGCTYFRVNHLDYREEGYVKFKLEGYRDTDHRFVLGGNPLALIPFRAACNSENYSDVMEIAYNHVKSLAGWGNAVDTQ